MLDHPKTPVASFANLRVEFETKDGTVVGVEDVSFEINAGGKPFALWGNQALANRFHRSQ